VAIEFNCPHCGKLLTTTESRALALAKCPACGDLITVPAASDPDPFASSGTVRNPEFAATAAWGNAPTPGPTAPPAAPFVPGMGAAPPAAGFPPSGIDQAGQPAYQTPIAPPLDGHAPPANGGTAASVPTRTVPESPGGAIVSALPRDAQVAPGQQASGLPGLHACPQCGYPAAPGAIYCAVCGVPLVPAAYPLRYAGFFRRSLAQVIDWAIVAVAAGALMRLLPWSGWPAVFFVWFFYNAALESSREQATLGKRLLGMFVCGVDGRRLTFARAGIRTLAKLLSLAICGMGFVMPLLTPKKQALQDLMTDAVVLLA
jgi:uncharacterized RDD family membrane protein YckC